MADAVLDLCGAGALDNLSTGQCARGGLYKVFYGKFSELDLVGTTFNATTKEVTAIAMTGMATMYEAVVDKESARYDFSLQNGVYYQNDVIFNINGKGLANWSVINNMKGLCGDLFFVVYGADCGGRVVGISRNTEDDAFIQSWDAVQLAEHLDTSGNLTERARDELTFRCKDDHSPLYTSVAIGSIPL